MDVVEDATNLVELNLSDMLFCDQPAASSQTVTYGVQRRGYGEVVLHAHLCADWRSYILGNTDVGVFEKQQVACGQLKQHMKQVLCPVKDVLICRDCFEGTKTPVHGLLRVLRPGGWRGLGGARAGLSTLLWFEAWNNSNIDRWMGWLSGLSAEQIRNHGRMVVGWDTIECEQYSMCFEADGFDSLGWRVGLGDHKVVTVNHGGDGSTGRGKQLAVYGLLPTRLLPQNYVGYKGLTALVDENFTKTMMEIAVSLYEAEKATPVRAGVIRSRRLMVNRAIQNAQLCLA